MQFSATLITLFIAVASAAPQLGALTDGLSGAAHPADSLDPLRTGAASAQCGNGQVLSCCSTKGADSTGSLLGSLAQNLAGGNCEMIPIAVIAVNEILNNACESNTAACCTGDENSLVDIPCLPINA